METEKTFRKVACFECLDPEYPDLENAALMRLKDGWIRLVYPTAIAQGPFCWISPEDCNEFWKEHRHLVSRKHFPKL